MQITVPCSSAVRARTGAAIHRTDLSPSDISSRKPRVQEELSDSRARVLGRPDLAYPWARLGIEYDGATHQDSLVEDNRRQNMLPREFGVVLLRYTAADVYNRPATIVDDVKSVLSRDQASPAFGKPSTSAVAVFRHSARDSHGCAIIGTP